MKQKFRICQVLCGPQRHCIIALLAPVDAEDASGERFIEMTKAGVKCLLIGKGKEINDGWPDWMAKHCGICGAPHEKWKYEVGILKGEYKDADEARDALRFMEEQNRLSREALDILGLSYDARRARAKHHKN